MRNWGFAGLMRRGHSGCGLIRGGDKITLWNFQDWGKIIASRLHWDVIMTLWERENVAATIEWSDIFGNTATGADVHAVVLLFAAIQSSLIQPFCHWTTLIPPRRDLPASQFWQLYLKTVHRRGEGKGETSKSCHAATRKASRAVLDLSKVFSVVPYICKFNVKLKHQISWNIKFESILITFF